MVGVRKVFAVYKVFTAGHYLCLSEDCVKFVKGTVVDIAVSSNDGNVHHRPMCLLLMDTAITGT